MVSKQYLETARTLLRIARNMANQTVADRLKALAGDYERRAAQASNAEAARSKANRPSAKVLPESIDFTEHYKYSDLVE
jgi:hypothetical protein